MIVRSRAFCATLLLVAACSGPDAQTLRTSVQRYNEGLRWKRFTDAAQYRAPDEQTAFLKRYLASEEDLHIESMEVRAVRPLTNEATPTFEVTVVAEAYVLPSTVLDKIVMVEKWQARGDAWVLVSCDTELAPELAH